MHKLNWKQVKYSSNWKNWKKKKQNPQNFIKTINISIKSMYDDLCLWCIYGALGKATSFEKQQSKKVLSISCTFNISY